MTYLEKVAGGRTWAAAINVCFLCVWKGGTTSRFSACIYPLITGSPFDSTKTFDVKFDFNKLGYDEIPTRKKHKIIIKIATFFALHFFEQIF
jgi:hypothetical protein